jgi:hypothetical protein
MSLRTGKRQARRGERTDRLKGALVKVPYKWVKRDTGLIAAGYDKKKDVNQQLVTPYGHVPKPLIDAKPKLKFDASSAAPPELIELDDAWGRPDLGLPRFRDAVAKNTNGELVLEWATVPDDILKKATTLGELCTALHASNKAVYPAYLYAKESLGGAPPIPELNQEGDSAYQLKMPMLLFEHWCNTELRYRVISGGSVLLQHGLAEDSDGRVAEVEGAHVAAHPKEGDREVV